MTGLAPTSLRHTMAHFATGVTVVTTLEDGHDHAMTANSLTSVSLDPPLVLVCVAKDTGWHEAVTQSGVWGISILPSAARPAASWWAQAFACWLSATSMSWTSVLVTWLLASRPWRVMRIL